MRLDSQAPVSQADQRVTRLLELYASAERPDHRISIMQEVARLLEAEGDPDAAWSALLEALDDDLEFAPVLSELARLSDELDRWGDLVEALIERARAAEDFAPARAAELWVRLAQWYDEPLGEREYARHSLRAALRCHDEHAAARRMLVRFAREESDWHELALQLDRLAAATDRPAEARDARMELARLYERALPDRERAVAAYRGAVATGADAPAALAALDRLYREAEQWRELVDVLSARAELAETGAERLRFELERARLAELRLAERWPAQLKDWSAAVRVLDRVAAETQDPRHRADVWWQRGEIELGELRDPVAAEHSFVEALVHEPGHMRSLLALADLYEQRGDWAKAARCAADAGRAADDGAARVRLFARAASLAADRLTDDDLAIRYYELVRAHDPDNLDALIALGELYLRRERWSEAEPVLNKLAAATDMRGLDPELRAQLRCQAGVCALAQGETDAAIEHFRAACALDAGCDDARARWADALFLRGAFGDAAAHYTQLVDRGAATVTQRVRLARCHRELGDAVKALVAYHGALREDPRCREALAGIAELYAARGEWESVARAKRALVSGAEADERHRLLCEIAAISRDHLHEYAAAIDAYRLAAELRPLDHSGLQALLDLYAQTERWEEAIAVIETFVAREPSPVRRGKYLAAAAVIQRDELHEPDSAIACLERALDAYFAGGEPVPAAEREQRFKPFAALDALITARRDWQRQRLAYRAMIRRLPAGDPVLPQLWHALGEICRTRLHDYRAAIEAFEVAQVLDPGDRVRAKIIAELRALPR